MVEKDVEDVISRLLAADPTIGTAWQEHLDFWEGDESRGGYNDIGVIARHLVQLVADHQDADVRALFDVVEDVYAGTPSREVSNLLTVGLIEDIQNSTSWPRSPVGSSAFLPFLKPLTLAAWNGHRQRWGTSET
jgi:hypothetical protein